MARVGIDVTRVQVTVPASDWNKLRVAVGIAPDEASAIDIAGI